MLVFDQLKKDDPQLRFLAFIVLAGLLVLFTGLWWVQLVSSRHYQEKLLIQSIRTVRIPAVRGKILDREGRSLAENRPSYNVDLYLEELSTNFQGAYASALRATKTNLNLAMAQRQKELGRSLTPQEKKQFAVTEAIKDQLKQQTRYQVVSNLLANLGARLQEPVSLPQKDFQKQYDKARALPLPIFRDSLNPIQLARFEEQSAAETGMDLEVQSMRYYPNGTVGAHLLGYLQHNNDSGEGERTNYNYRLPDYVGVTGMEGLFDAELRGIAGEKSVLVNYLGYRQSETVWAPAVPGSNIVLTIDLDIQKAAENALLTQQANVRGAVIVMDAQNGDVLAMASAPTYDPNHRLRPDPATREKEDESWNDPLLGLQRNRAIYENYHPGSIFKIIVGMAALEVGVLDPNAIFLSDGYYQVGRSSHHYGDTAGPGKFDFNRAMAKSSNPYFVHYGTNAGVLEKVIEIGHHLHLGERTGIVPHQEAAGNLPTLERISSNWYLGDTANVSIGQGVIDVTTIQMAIMTAAVGNGGKVFWPRLVTRIESADGTGAVQEFPAGRVRDMLGVSRHTLEIVRGGMLADVESAEGSGSKLNIPGWIIAGKTGTAEVVHEGQKDRKFKDTWFVSYSSEPDGKARYVVVATVEGGYSGALTCVPIAHKVYLALQERDQHPFKKKSSKQGTLATAQ